MRLHSHWKFFSRVRGRRNDSYEISILPTTNKYPAYWGLLFLSLSLSFFDRSERSFVFALLIIAELWDVARARSRTRLYHWSGARAGEVNLFGNAVNLVCYQSQVALSTFQQVTSRRNFNIRCVVLRHAITSSESRRTSCQLCQRLGTFF